MLHVLIGFGAVNYFPWFLFTYPFKYLLHYSLIIYLNTGEFQEL